MIANKSVLKFEKFTMNKKKETHEPFAHKDYREGKFDFVKKHIK
jgi:hypothetical protein